MRIWMGLETCASRAPGMFFIYFIFTLLIFHYKQTTLQELKRLGHPPTMIGLETCSQTRLHLSVSFFYILFSYFINKSYYLP